MCLPFPERSAEARFPASLLPRPLRRLASPAPSVRTLTITRVTLRATNRALATRLHRSSRSFVAATEASKPSNIGHRARPTSRRRAAARSGPHRGAPRPPRRSQRRLLPPLPPAPLLRGLGHREPLHCLLDLGSWRIGWSVFSCCWRWTWKQDH